VHDSPTERAPTRTRRDGDLVGNLRTTAVPALAMLAAVVLLTVMVAIDTAAPPFQGLDDAWRRLVLGWPGPTRSFGELFEVLGAGVVMIPLRIAVAAWLAFRRRRWDLAAWLLGWLVADLLTAVLKPGLGRERPTPIDPDNPFTSFPSAHAKTAAQVAIGLVLVTTSPWRGRRAWFGLAVMWVVLMSLSRTVLDHHWLSDVLAGSLLGAGCAFLAAATLQVMRDRQGEPARDGRPPPAPR